jgi:hypothetical protein
LLTNFQVENVEKKSANVEDHLKVLNEEKEELKMTRDNFTEWTIDDVLARNPKWAERIQNDMANENWEVKNDHN